VFDGICIYTNDPDPYKRKLVECNERYASMAGRTRDELLQHKSTQDLQRTLEESANANRMESLARGDVYQGFFSWIRPDGKENIVEYTGVPITWQGEAYSIGIDRDITEQKRAERALRESEKKYRDIVTWAPIGIYQSTRSGEMISANSSIAKLLGCDNVDELIGCNMGQSIYYDDEDRKRFIAQHDASGENVALSFETRWRKKDGSIVWVLMTVHDLRDKSGEILYYEGFVFDITERKHAEEALRESEERYRLLVENSTDLVIEIDADGKFLYISPNVKLILGFEPADLVGTSVLSRIYGKDKSLMKEILKKQGGNVMYRYGNNLGVWHWFESSGRVYNTSSGERRMVMVSRDITQRRKAEQELDLSRKQLQHFTEHLEQVLEEERKRISRELHDELGQLLTILKFDLSWLRLEGVKDSTDVLMKIDGMMDALNEALASVKRISKEIRPPQLEALGLGGSIQWDIDQVEKKTGLKGMVTIEPAELEVKAQIGEVLYRVFREALTNIVRHAQAENVYIRLTRRLDSIILTIRDDGRGITKKELTNTTTLGLVGIRERIRTISGTLALEGKPGKGTMLSVEVPLKKKRNGDRKS
jgi:PAS domain S-box-containing protein